MSKIIVNVFQPDIRKYRADFFSGLADKYNLDLRVIYGLDSPELEGGGYTAIMLKSHRFLGLNLQCVPVSRFFDADINVVCFDLHWPVPLLYGLLFSRSRPVLYWGHGVGRGRFAWKLKKLLLMRSKGLIAYSDGRARKAVDLGLPKNKAFVARNSMSVPNRSDLSSDEKKYFLYVGRIQERKKILQLVRDYHDYLRLGGTLDLYLVGAGGPDYERVIRNECDLLGVSGKVNFLGPIHDHETLRSVFSAALAYVCPGDVGLGVIHSFSYGVPVVTQVGEMHGPEYEALEDGVNSFCVVPSEHAFSERMIYMDSNRLMSKGMGESAYQKYLDLYSIDRMQGDFFDAIQSAINV